MSVETSRTGKGKFTAKNESKTLVKANANRTLLVITNPSTKDMWLALGATAAKEEGIYLKKEGGAVMLGGSGTEGYTGEVTVITTEGEGVVTYAEV